MYKVFALAALLAALPTTVFAQTIPTTEPTAAPAAAPAPTENDQGSRLFRGNVAGCQSIGSITARATVTFPSCTVPKDHLLISGGYSNQSVKGVGNTVTYPNVLIRAGTSVPGLEVDFSPPTLTRVTPAVGPTSGASDLGAGLTYQLPSFGPIHETINALVFAPTADRGFGSTTGADSTVRLNLGSSLLGFGIGASVRFDSTVDPMTNLRFQAFVPSLVIGHDLEFIPGNVFFEAAHFSRVASFGDPEWNYTTGYRVPIANRTQLDAEYGFSPSVLGHPARSVGAGFGFLF